MKTSHLKKVVIDDHKWWVRPDTQDEYVIKEARGYFKRMNLEREDIVLDAGANIGAFACRAAPRVHKVIAVEPAPDNLELLWENVRLHHLDNVVVVPKALVPDDAEKVSLFLNQATNPGAHSQFVQRGREEITVPARNINRLLEKYHVNKFKMDVEGAEHQLLMGMTKARWRMINSFVIEYHFAALKDKDHRMYRRLLLRLTTRGFELEGPAWNESMKNWHVLLAGSRP